MVLSVSRPGIVRAGIVRAGIVSDSPVNLPFIQRATAKAMKLRVHGVG